MAALQQFLHFGGHSLHIRRITHLHIQRVNSFHGNEILLHRDRNQHGLIVEFRLPERIHLLAEGADHGELKTANLDGSADGGRLASEKFERQLLRKQRNLLHAN